MSTMGTAGRILWGMAVVYSEALTTAEQMAETAPSPTQHRVALATAAAGMSVEQLHSIALVIADNRSRYNVAYRECGYIGRRPYDYEEGDYRKAVLAAISNCPDESLVHLAILFAGAKS